MIRAILILGIMTTVPAQVRAADCLQKCEARKKEIARKLEDCLAQTRLMERKRAILFRKACYKKYVAPRCDGLPACVKEKGAAAHPPGLKLGTVVFSAKRRGAPLARPAYRAGSELFFRVEATVTTKPKATGIWLQLDLTLLTTSHAGKKVPVVNWEKYLEQKTFLEAARRGTPQRYTLHGGAQLPGSFDPGTYEARIVVKERVSGFSSAKSATFTVTAGATRKKKKRRKRR